VANTIRTPRLGTNATSRRIAEAVDDEDWQRFRVSMKGTTTETKLSMLKKYWWDHHTKAGMQDCGNKDCDVCIRVDNYIKALCRGGQLHPGEDLYTVFFANWKPQIRR